MIPQTELRGQDQSWQQAMQDIIKTPTELAEALALDLAELGATSGAAFPLKIPRRMLNHMKRGDSSDPVLLQAALPKWQHDRK